MAVRYEVWEGNTKHSTHETEDRAVLVASCLNSVEVEVVKVEDVDCSNPKQELKDILKNVTSREVLSLNTCKVLCEIAGIEYDDYYSVCRAAYILQIGDIVIPLVNKIELEEEEKAERKKVKKSRKPNTIWFVRNSLEDGTPVEWAYNHGDGSYLVISALDDGTFNVVDYDGYTKNCSSLKNAKTWAKKHLIF